LYTCDTTDPTPPALLFLGAFASNSSNLDSVGKYGLYCVLLKLTILTFAGLVSTLYVYCSALSFGSSGFKAGAVIFGFSNPQDGVLS